jgi:hypothetical protein
MHNELESSIKQREKIELHSILKNQELIQQVKQKGLDGQQKTVAHTDTIENESV